MKKTGFVEGAFIATVAIFISKMLGVLYIIPFYHMVGLKGSILYGYAYSIYIIFLSLSTSGITIAISRTVSEYNALGLFNLKERIYKLASLLIISLGIIFFLVLIVFAGDLAHFILGDLKGGNTIEEVTLVIRLISLAFLIVPLFSVTQGYLQGHRFLYITSKATLIEQLTRVFIIVFGSYILIGLLGYNIEAGVGIAVFGASAGAVIAYGYLVGNMKRYRRDLIKDAKPTEQEKGVTNKQLIQRIILYALPFILIDVFKSGLYFIDTLTVVRTIVSLGQPEIAEITLGIINSLGSKMNMIIVSVSIGITISLIPSLSASYAKGDLADIHLKLNQTLQTVLLVCLPMTLGIFFLVQPMWVVFYSYDQLSITIFKLYVFQALVFSVFSILIKTFQTMNATRYALGSVFVVVLAKSFLNVPFMKMFNNFNWPLYYSPIVLTMILQITGIVFLVFMLKRKYQFDLLAKYHNYLKIILNAAIMMLVLLIVNLFVPIIEINKLGALKELLIFSLIGSVTYIFVAYKSGIFHDIYGKKMAGKGILKIKNMLVFKRK